MTVSIDSVNGKGSLQRADGYHTCIESGGPASSVRNAVGGVMDSLQGTAYVTLFDAEMDRSFPDNGTIYTYKRLGGAIYKGTCSVVNGRIKATCFVPKDIAYQNKNGRIAVYMMSGAKDGRAPHGYYRRRNNGCNIDGSGRGLHWLYLDSRSFRPGDLVGENPTMIIDLA